MAIPRTTDTDDNGTGTTGTIHDNAWLQAIYDAIESWDVDSYTPAWTSSGVAPAVGNATNVGKYIAIGDLVVFRVALTFGDTSTFGTGNYSISLPLSGVVGSGVIKLWTQDVSGGGTTYSGHGFISTTTTFLLLSDDTAGITGAASTWTPTAPIPFDDPDVIYAVGAYFRA